MHKCLKITFSADFPDGFLHDVVQKAAQSLELEGTVQVVSVNNKARIVVCGPKEKVDEFLDIIHKGTAKYVPEEVEIEAFVKDKDYRGVFRVIE